MIVNLQLMCSLTSGLEIEDIFVLDAPSREVAQAVAGSFNDLLRRARST
jgi:hypothetical protein